MIQWGPTSTIYPKNEDPVEVQEGASAMLGHKERLRHVSVHLMILIESFDGFEAR